MHWMASNCAAFLDRNTLFLSLKQEYATVLFKNMESPLVAKARTCYTPECIVSLHKNSPAQCFTTSTPANIYQCFQIEWGYCQENGQESSSGNVMRDVFDATLVCLDSYHDCIMDHLNGALHLYNGGDNTIGKRGQGQRRKTTRRRIVGGSRGGSTLVVLVVFIIVASKSVSNDETLCMFRSNRIAL